MEPGTRIELVYTDDPYTRLKPGSQGTLRRHWRSDPPDGCDWVEVDWDDGSNLRLMQEVGDKWREVK